MSWKNLSIGKKISLPMGVLLIIICLMAGIFLRTISTLSAETRAVQEVEGLAAIMLNREIDHLKWIVALQRFVYDDKQTSLSIQEDARMCNLGQWYHGSGRQEAVKRLPGLASPLDSMRQPHESLHATAATIRGLRAEGRQQELEEVFEQVSLPSMRQVQERLMDITGILEVEKKKSLAVFSSAARTALYSTCGSAAGALLLALLMTLLLIRSISRPTTELERFANQVAEGDYEARSGLVRDDEIGRLAHSIEDMVGKMVAVIARADEKTAEAEQQSRKAENAMREAEEAKQAAEKATREGMHEAAAQLEAIVGEAMRACDVLSQSVTQAAHGAGDQLRHASEAASAMEEMSKAILEVARSASSASESADGAKKNAEQGSNIVIQTMAAIEEVHKQTVTLTGNMNVLGQQAQGIGSVMNVISDIADQTNLLALNAAIEAARAGEAGRGFAVVADEVRKLAEKTMLATKEVSDVINGIQNSARESIQGMEQAAQLVDRSTTLAHEAEDSLVHIVAIAETTAGQVQSIATASEEQSATSEQIRRGTSEINSLADDNSRLMQQADTAVRDLGKLTHRISDVVEALKRA